MMSSPIASLVRNLRVVALLLGLGVVAFAAGCGVPGSGASSEPPSASPSSTTSLSTGALDGQVVARDSCGAQNPVATCTPAPIIAASVIVRTTTDAVVATATTDTHGQFHMILAPGRYLVQARPGSESGGASAAAVLSVTVEAGRTTTVQLVVSSPPRP